jgi:hypothetical protein
MGRNEGAHGCLNHTRLSNAILLILVFTRIDETNLSATFFNRIEQSFLSLRQLPVHKAHVSDLITYLNSILKSSSVIIVYQTAGSSTKILIFVHIFAVLSILFRR